jgi:hypothetical protein
MPFISHKQLDEFKTTHDALQQELEKLKARPFLIGIERAARVNKFTFCRDGEMYVVETMGLLSDNLPEWREKLLR